VSQIHPGQVEERLTVPAGATAATAVDAAGLPTSGPRAIVVVRAQDGSLKDLTWVPDEDTEVEPVPMSSPDGLNVLRHSTAHVLAQAVQDVFPEAKLGIGPPIENGFYYDFSVDTPFNPDDLERIEKRMKEIIKSGQRFQRRVFPSVEAARAELANEPYKLELIDDKSGVDADELMEVGSGELTIYDNIDRKDGHVCWSDLCRGPHLPSTKLIYAQRLLRSAAAYWRGSEKNPQLQRIYGTAWPSKDELKAHITRLEEAAKRDHRRIGEALELFTFSKEIGKGLPLWLPNGAIIRDELEGWARETERRGGYQRVYTPHITREDLYYLSGHLPYYTEDLYSPIDIEGEKYYLKPMNCPHHHMIYRARPRSYRELPYRIAEYGTVYRYEKSGQLLGMMRVRGFSQNDAHIYCTYEQAKAEFLEVMRLHDSYYKSLGITDFYMVLALRDPDNKDKYHDDDLMWERAEKITREAMDESGIPYRHPLRRGHRGGRSLRAQGRLHHPLGHRQGVRRVDQPGRPLHPRAVRPHLSRCQRGRGARRRDPPSAARLARALRRLPDRALRRVLPGLAGARAGCRHPGHARDGRLRDRSQGPSRHRGHQGARRSQRRTAVRQGPHRCHPEDPADPRGRPA
jgi:threonyl-tRNA synthetase